jgi:hypothetical protein
MKRFFFSRLSPLSGRTHRNVHMELAKQALRDNRGGDATYHLMMAGVVL